MHIETFILGVFGVWRVTHLLNGEDGPSDIFVRLRRLAGRGFWGQLLDCFFCLSVWVAAGFALLLGKGWRERLAMLPALSGGAILLDKVISGPPVTPPVEYYEDEA